MARPQRIDCSNVELLRISRPACLAIIASACEVFPKECMGTICCMEPPVKVGKIVAAFPFQKADRKRSEVDSYSFFFFQEMLSSGPWHTLGSFHSHPETKRSSAQCAPSEFDLRGMDPGDLEIIVRIRHSRKTKKNAWKSTSTGRCSISWGKFQFLIGAFIRMGEDEDNIWYRKAWLEIL